MTCSTAYAAASRNLLLVALAMASTGCGDLAQLIESTKSDAVADQASKDADGAAPSAAGNPSPGAPRAEDNANGGGEAGPTAPTDTDPETANGPAEKTPTSPPTDPAPSPDYADEDLYFPLVQPQNIVATACVPAAKGDVRVHSEGPVEVMEVSLSGLPPQTLFGLFVTQVPNFPFGISWYQGELETDDQGAAKGTFIGRFNLEVFAVAPDAADAPQLHDGDAVQSAKTAPVHTYHLGLWFDSPQDAEKLGCPNVVTPFNEEHNAGVQVLNTSSFADDAGPLSQLK